MSKKGQKSRGRGKEKDNEKQENSCDFFFQYAQVDRQERKVFTGKLTQGTNYGKCLETGKRQNPLLEQKKPLMRGGAPSELLDFQIFIFGRSFLTQNSKTSIFSAKLRVGVRWIIHAEEREG